MGSIADIERTWLRRTVLVAAFGPLCALALIWDGAVRGVLEVIREIPGAFRQGWTGQ